jgi:hypothetical protein
MNIKTLLFTLSDTSLSGSFGDGIIGCEYVAAQRTIRILFYL